MWLWLWCIHHLHLDRLLHRSSRSENWLLCHLCYELIVWEGWTRLRWCHAFMLLESHRWRHGWHLEDLVVDGLSWSQVVLSRLRHEICGLWSWLLPSQFMWLRRRRRLLSTVPLIKLWIWLSHGRRLLRKGRLLIEVSWCLDLAKIDHFTS